MAKGETLSNVGEFEKALVQFERGWRVRQDHAIKSGMVKCRDAIMNTVGSTAMQDNKDMLEMVIKQMREGKVELTEDADPRVLKQEKRKAAAEKKVSDKRLLGKLNTDVQFLEKFLKTQTAENKKKVQITGLQTRVNNKATEALEYLEKRKNFWQQTVMATKK